MVTLAWSTVTTPLATMVLVASMVATVAPETFLRVMNLPATATTSWLNTSFRSATEAMASDTLLTTVNGVLSKCIKLVVLGVSSRKP